MTLPVNKQDTDGIEITQIRRLWSINICSHTWHSYKVRYIKKRISITFKKPSSSPCQRFNYSFIKSTKNQMSNLSPTWILTMDLTILLLLYFKWSLNLEYLDPRQKTLWFNFDLEKENPSHRSTLDLFKIKSKFICLMMKQDKQTNSRIFISLNLQNWNTYNYTLLQLN